LLPTGTMRPSSAHVPDPGVAACVEPEPVVTLGLKVGWVHVCTCRHPQARMSVTAPLGNAVPRQQAVTPVRPLDLFRLASIASCPS
jgi:hypothetical protein